jgi:hypothetical protein
MAYALNFDDCFVENLYLQPIAFWWVYCVGVYIIC